MYDEAFALVVYGVLVVLFGGRSSAENSAMFEPCSVGALETNAITS